MKVKEFINMEENLKTRYDRKNNIFDYIKIILALFVILSHSYPIFFGMNEHGPITLNILRTETLGGIAVIGFLLISGFMTTQSIMHSKNNREFLFKRILRIFPPLILMLLMTIFVFAPMGYEGNREEYFNESVSNYFFKNLNLFGNTSYSIEGVFTNNIYPSAINGSIWVLKHEFMAYIVLIVLALCNILKERKYMLGITILAIIIYVFEFNYKLTINFLTNFGVFNELNQFIKILVYFFIGASIYLYADKIKMSFKLFTMAVFILLFGITINLTKYVAIITIPYILIYLGTIKINEKKDFLKKIGDFTYAMFIYAFPIQQLISFYLNGKITIWIFMLLSIIITVIISIITTLLVDNNIKKLKGKLIPKLFKEEK